MADVPHEAPHHAVKGGIGLLKKMPPWAWIVIAGIVILVALYLRSRANANTSNAAQAPQGTDPNADPSQYAANSSNLDSAYLSGYESASGMFGGGGSYGYTPVTTLPSATGADNTVTSPGTDVSNPAGGAGQPITVNVSYPSPATGGGPPARPNVHGGPASNSKLLAPGAKPPSYTLTRPSGVPANARWSGSKAPGKNWKGVGGGWWVPK
jgi:hypothetical protein